MEFSRQIDFEELASKDRPSLLFKHSTRCSISTMALGRVERQLSDLQKSMDVYFVDVIGDRNLSNEIAERYELTHESPQALLISKGKLVYDASHNAIAPADILAQV